MAKLAVVLITRNQAWNIQRLIESVLGESASVSSREVVLVDSASTDDTVEIARRFPLTILRLRPDQHLSAAAGRFVGYQRTRSEYILFLDGDMELRSHWLERALAVIDADCTIGIVTGPVIDILPSSVLTENTRSGSRCDEVAEVRMCGGAALYRRSVLEQVGSFNPYLYSDEEPELCVRVRSKGYRIVQLQCAIANHYSEPSNEVWGLISRRRRRLYLGSGQNIRYYVGTGLLWAYIRERDFVLVPLLVLGAGLLSLFWATVSQNWLWFRGWAMLSGSVILVDACRKRSFYLTIVSLVKRVFIIEGTIKGLLLRPLAPDTYPAKMT